MRGKKEEKLSVFFSTAHSLVCRRTFADVNLTVWFPAQKSFKKKDQTKLLKKQVGFHMSDKIFVWMASFMLLYEHLL